jgi:ubiquinone/menaquinone biosynthesis C-methylase UbiE
MKIERFDVIAKHYEAAISQYPNCRHDHEWLFEQVRHPVAKVLEVSGGTGYLTGKIIKNCAPQQLVIHDVSKKMLKINENKFSEHPGVSYYIDSNMQLNQLEDQYFDLALNLGGFHHIEEQVLFFKSMHRVLKKGASVIFGDFVDDSPVQRYFDERVHQFTETGHQGLFASYSRLVNLARFSGFNKAIVKKKKVPFSFNNKMEIGQFFNQVHGLDQRIEETYKDIEDYFEIIEMDNQLMVIMDYIYGCYTKT